MNSFVKGYVNGYCDSQAKVDGSLSTFQARALPGVQTQRDKYRGEALAWRMFYEELRPFIVCTPEADEWKRQADELLSDVRGPHNP